MARLELTSKTRTDFKKSDTKQLRRAGNIPATVYGKGIEPISLEIPAEDFAVVLRSPGARLSLIDLKIDGRGEAAHPVMIQALQMDPITKKAVHVDFHRVQMDVEVHASVPINLVGTPVGLVEGGLLEQFTPSLDIKALPDHMPRYIDVDVSHLKVGDTIHVSDVQVPADVEVLGPVPENLVATVRLPAAAHAAAESAVEAATEAEATPAAG
jgi:large subunit ribosomal protein L25